MVKSLSLQPFLRVVLSEQILSKREVDRRLSSMPFLPRGNRGQRPQENGAVGNKREIKSPGQTVEGGPSTLLTGAFRRL